ncbi:winged helix-turn-helix domain-containing protein [Bradyrhizobium sp. Cp5.3]|uniref:ATP-binding protein n=1 Tax=Bradyrhizobium sp. Cp5.3 TaxID=443598 RepID=UPI0003FA147C|nr:winged helix-turn-helix domain-containing protein [Bradyrhizobium sp. Cp5.3]
MLDVPRIRTEETLKQDVNLVPCEQGVFGSSEWELDLSTRQLRANGVTVSIGSRAFEIVETLVRSDGQLVTKDELVRHTWPGATIVEDGTIRVHISAIRKALGADRGILQTVSGRGYRLLGNWTIRQDRAPAEPEQATASPTSFRTNVPIAASALVGRESAVQHLCNLASAYRAVTLTGPGGIGKTVLASEVARRLFATIASDVFFVELASLSDPALVPSTAASVLGLQLGSDDITPASVARAIGKRKVLLVVDNCEHVIDAAAELAETLLHRCPHTTLLATSREVLRIEGEFVYHVAPLDVPSQHQEASSDVLARSAVQLFIARMGSVQENVLAQDENLPAIGSIVRRLDGIPLAIELAAARAATFGIQDVAARLDDRFALLTGARRTALPRHQTLRATLDWSYKLLPETERVLLHCLAIFVGPFSVDAASAVASMTEADLVDRIGGLVAKSLLLKVENSVGPQFRLLEMTRAYAFDRLSESGAFAEVARRHAEYFLKVLGQAEVEAQSSGQRPAASGRRADEIHAALDWAFSGAGDPSLGVALTIAAVPLWFDLSRPTVARGRIEQALPHAEMGGDDEMQLRIALGYSFWYLGPATHAIGANFARALEIAERIGAVAVQTRALWGLWAAHRGREDHRAALDVALRFADAARKAGDLGATHLADRVIALTHHLLGHQQLAQEWTERTLRQPHRLAPSMGMGYQVETPVAMQALLARILWIRGFPDQALAAAAAATSAAGATGHSFALAYALAFAGLPVALWTGAPEAGRLLDMFATHAGGNRNLEEWRLCYARALEFRQGSEGEALIASFVEPRVDPSRIAPFADRPIGTHILVPPPGEPPVDLPWSAPELLRVDAMLLLWHRAPGADDAAEAKLLRALEVAGAQSALSWELRAVMSLALLWQRHGRTVEARDRLVATYEKFTEGFGTRDLVQARSLIADLESDKTSA